MDLDQYLEFEIVKTEKRRLDIFMGVILVSLIIYFFLWIFYAPVVESVFLHEQTFSTIPLMACTGLLIMLFSRKIVSKHEKRNKCLSQLYQWYTVFVETLLPCLWLLAVSKMEQTSSFINSPAVFLFFVMIIVSSLHLNFLLSVTLGLVLAVFHSAFTVWVSTEYGSFNGLPVEVYHFRSVMILLCGVCAGLVALELKKRMITSFSFMKEKSEIENLFNQQVSKEVVEALKQQEDFSASYEVSVLFLDIRAFTQKVETLPPEEVVKFQNLFFSPIVDIINDYKGITNQLLGDGLMATFGAPIKDQHHAQNSLNAIHEIFGFLETFNRENPDYGNIRIGVGIHCGDVVVGNIGTGMRRQFSVSGIPVIIASRIEQLNKEYDSSLLMSRPYYEKVKNQIDQAASSLGMIKIKGIQREVEVIQITTSMDTGIGKIIPPPEMKEQK